MTQRSLATKTKSATDPVCNWPHQVESATQSLNSLVLCLLGSTRRWWRRTTNYSAARGPAPAAVAPPSSRPLLPAAAAPLSPSTAAPPPTPSAASWRHLASSRAPTPSEPPATSELLFPDRLPLPVKASAAILAKPRTLFPLPRAVLRPGVSGLRTNDLDSDWLFL